MSTSFIYRKPLIYEALMLTLYGRHYFARYQVLSDLIPADSSVTDLCCGPAILYSRYLRHKRIQYTGLDLSESFVSQLRQRKINARVWDVHASDPLPSADYVIMQASLYHFLPKAAPVLGRMLAAARKQVIIAEPVRNLTSSSVGMIAAKSRRWTDPGDGSSNHRFTEDTLDRFFAPHASRVVQAFLIPGGREKVFVLNADTSVSSA